MLKPSPIAADVPLFTPDDLLAGKRPAAKTVLIYDDDHYYMGGVLAELLAREGFAVSIAFPTGDVSRWMVMTMEQHQVAARLLEVGVKMVPHRVLASAARGTAELRCVFSGKTEEVAADAIVLVTARLPNDALAKGLHMRKADWADAGIKSVTTIGDAYTPGTIAAAVYWGRKAAEDFETSRPQDDPPFRREVTGLADVDVGGFLERLGR